MTIIHDFVSKMVEDILHQEGGFVDDPDDKGGPTKHGVSLRYARNIGLDLDGDGDTDKDDIMLVDERIARQLYLSDFYLAPRINTLPEPLQPFTFDSAVNHGPARAIMFVQGAVNHWGFTLQMDGRIGKKTRQALEDLQQITDFTWPQLIRVMVSLRLLLYRNIVATDATQEKWLDGWKARAYSFLDSREIRT